MRLGEIRGNTGLLGQAARFAVVGGINTCVDLGLFTVLLYLFDLHLLLANAGGFLAAVLVSYVLNKSWTFADASRGQAAIQRGLAFLAIAVVGLAIGSAVIWLAALLVHPLLAKLASIGATFVWNFGASRRWVFRAAQPRPASARATFEAGSRPR